MPAKRSYDDVDQNGSRPSSPDTQDSILNKNATPPTQPSNISARAQGKQRRLSFVEENGDYASASTSSRPRALPSTSTARFVPGLQTFVGGLQMSQDSSVPQAEDTAVQQRRPSASRRSLDSPDAMQPLMMSRNADGERRASQAIERRRSEATLAVARRESLVAQEAQLVPGVSPGWHVEAHGRQAMELQDGIRSQDEDGWTPLEAFPASTRQGKLAVKRAKLRRRLQQQRHEPSHNRPHHAQDEKDPTSWPASSHASIPTISVETASSKACTTIHPPLPPSVAWLDVEMKDDMPSHLSVLMQTSSSPDDPHWALASTSASPLSSSSAATTLSTPTSFPEQSTETANAPSSAHEAYSLSDFEVIDTLGTGTYGRVLLVRLKDRDVMDRSAYFALKVLAKTAVVQLKQVAHLNSERSILTKVDHPFLVNMIASFQDSRNCYMLMDYVVGGEIFSYLRRAGRFSADVARFYISTIVLAIEYLHDKKIVYRDLKPENLLIDSNGYTKITDFGFAKEVEDRTWTLCGTPEYLAPEIIQSSGHGTAVDWWSLGILLFEMLAGYPPFYDPNQLAMYDKIVVGKLVFPDEIDSVSRDLISGLLTADRSRRLGNLRGGATDIKNHPWFSGVDWKALQEGRIPPPIVPYLGRPGDTSNFSAYPPARPSTMPGLFGTDRGHYDPRDDLFPDF